MRAADIGSTATLLSLLLGVLLLCAGVHAAPSNQEIPVSSNELNALHEYVNKPDANYQWTYHPEHDMQGEGYKVMWLNMTSQRWLTDADVDKSIWFHWVAIIVPRNLDPQFCEHSLLWIGGGSTSNTPPSIWDKELLVAAAAAQELQTLVVALFAIPNAPITFLKEQPPRRRSEDAIIAYAWARFLEEPDRPEWLPRLPMVKASLRAMDAATAFWKQQSSLVLDKWLVAGASKRGWTTWLVGAVDNQRVVGLMPMVLDLLNFVPNIKHQYRAYGGWSFALNDYYDTGFTTHLDHPNMVKMMDVIDPIRHNATLTMPKMVFSAAGDEFLMPDDVDYWISSMRGETHFKLFPNLEHMLLGNLTAVLECVRGFAMGVMTNTPRPYYEWNKEADGTIEVRVDAARPPSKVTLWQATTVDGKRRDFRLVALFPNEQGEMKPWLQPVWWSGTPLPPASSRQGVLTYRARVEPPKEGWVGFVIIMEWPGARNSTFTASTAPSILPNTFPFPECHGEECKGELV